MLFHKVKSVSPLADYRLLVHFQDGAQKHYDIKPLFKKWPPFTSLQTIKGLFPLVMVEPGGYAVSWNDDLDLACDELYFNGT